MKSLLSTSFILLSFFLNGQTFTEIIKAAAFDRESEDRMGYAVDVSGNYAIIGAYADDFGELNPNMGSAYIFEKTGIEDWKFVQKISNSDQDDYDRFGWSVAIDGDYVVVGAYGEDHDTEDSDYLSKAGSAYIFERNAEGIWEEVQKVVASDRDEADEFGWTVDVSSSTIIVGAHQEDEDEFGGDFIFRSGSVYAFERNDEGTWEETQKIVAWDRQADAGGGDETMSIWHYQGIDYGDLFGCSIAISGDYMIVGAHNGDYNPEGFGGISQSGSAYIFNRVDGIWTADQKVCATVRGGWDRYGYSVGIDSNVAVVGAKAEDHSEFEAAFLHNAGSAYIYTRGIDGIWTPQKIDASDRDVGDHFGIEVDVEGSYMVIGAEAHNFDEDTEDELANAGAAYIFEKDDAGIWSEIEKLDASDRDSLDLFADALAISGHTILIGAWQQDLDSASENYIEDAGAAYFFSSLLCTTEYTEQEIDLCAGESLTVGASIYAESGTYVDTLLNSDACDSVVTTMLTIAELIESDQTVELCFGEVFEVGESLYEETGVYADTLTNALGCDSIVTTDLTIYPEYGSEQTFSICAGEMVLVGESVYSEAGVYTDILESTTLCDSTVITTVVLIADIDPTVNLADEMILTSNEPESGSTSFQWIKCDPYAIIGGATEQSYMPEEDGEFAVIITVDECVDTSDCTLIMGVGIETFGSHTISIYPNPTYGEFTIQLNDHYTGGLNMSIVNHLGAIVVENRLISTTTHMQFSDLAKGVYFVRLMDGETVILKKLIIQ